MLEDVPDHFKTHEMCNEIMRIEPAAFYLIPDRLKTQEMCIEAVEVDPWHLKTQEMCDAAVREDPSSLESVPGWFVKQQQVRLWHQDGYCNDAKLVEWYYGYKKRKAQKAKIKKQLMPIAWHRSRWWDWCVSNDEKKDAEKLWK